MFQLMFLNWLIIDPAMDDSRSKHTMDFWKLMYDMDPAKTGWANTIMAFNNLGWYHMI